MNEAIYQLKPERLWYYFGEILKIPRASKKEHHIAHFVMAFGKEHKLDTSQDDTGNVIIRKPAYKGMEQLPSVALQGHLDMVCEKNNDIVHDFDADPIKAYVDSGWVKARGTTLGADDGIGVAVMLAILESQDIPHGPLECLFTVDEETGLAGAFGLKPGFVQSRILLNLDSEDDGEFFIGCAGGRDTVIELPYKREQPPSGHSPLLISVSGLVGGHSGDDIHKGRANANKILNRILWNAAFKFRIRISDFDAGNLRNAIAREGRSIIMIPDEYKASFLLYAKEYEEQVKNEYKVTDPDMTITVSPAKKPHFVMDEATQAKLLNALYACPHGVLAWSQEITGFVETSTNLAAVKTLDDLIRISTSQRSSVQSSKDDASNMIASVFNLTGAQIEQTVGYPGWTPDPHSRIMELSVNAYKNLFGESPVVRAIHAGLECGLIGDKYPGIDMISYGPTIKGAHSPDERLDIHTVEKFWNLTLEILSQIPERFAQ